MNDATVRFADGRVCTTWVGDCLDYLREFGDNEFDAVITDPPYGIRMSENRTSGKAGWAVWEPKEWDRNRPDRVVFDEIRRVSKTQIIWGGNYFADLLPPSSGWLVWDKGQRNFTLADVELAWTSSQQAARVVAFSRGKASMERAIGAGEFRKGGGSQEKIHPTQKPVGVMNYCVVWTEKQFFGFDVKDRNLKILDPFMGSGSTGVAVLRAGHDFFGIEIDPDYAGKAEDRLKAELSQTRLL